MRLESDTPGEFIPNEPEAPRTKPDLPASDPSRGTQPSRGGYYWLPAPSPGGITWSLVSCRDLGSGPDAGHEAELWPRVIDRLAEAWGRDAQALRRLLGNHHRGLPRGRTTGTKRKFQIFHGNDAPVPGWKEIVIDRCDLRGLKVKMSLEEDKRVLSGDVLAVEEALGVGLNLPRV